MKEETKKSHNEEVKQENTSGMKETANKTDRRNPKKGLPIKTSNGKGTNAE